jgi:hypothetical protein
VKNAGKRRDSFGLVTFALEQDAQRLKHIPLIVSNQNPCHCLSLNFVSGQCQLLCIGRANNRQSHQFSSGTDLRFFKDFPLYCRLWDLRVPILGRILGS